MLPRLRTALKHEVSPCKHQCLIQSKIGAAIEPNHRSQTSGQLATRSLVSISRIMTSGFRAETTPRSSRRSFFTVRPPTLCKWITVSPKRLKCSAARASKLDLSSELSLRTNEWPKIRTVGGELAIATNKTKERNSNQRKLWIRPHTRASKM